MRRVINTYWTVQCELSKYVEAYPLRNKDTVSVARSLVNNFILRYGPPQTIVTDRGTEFISSVMTQVCKLLRIEKHQSTAYHHETIGSLENTHKSMGSYLRIPCAKYPDTWSHWLPFWSFSYNNTVHSATKYTPFELVFGKTCELPSRISSTVEPLYNPSDYSLELRYRLQVARKDARENLIKTKQLRKCNYDLKVNTVKYKKDDLILVKSETGSKLETLFKGPYKVIEVKNPNVVISVNGKHDTVHINRTKLFVTS